MRASSHKELMRFTFSVMLSIVRSLRGGILTSEGSIVLLFLEFDN